MSPKALNQETEAFVLLQLDITQGLAHGVEVAWYETRDALEGSYIDARCYGQYQDSGHFWSGATVFMMAHIHSGGIWTLDGAPFAGPRGLTGPPIISSQTLGGDWSPV